MIREKIAGHIEKADGEDLLMAFFVIVILATAALSILGVGIYQFLALYWGCV